MLENPLLRQVGETMIAKNFDIEYHICSSDSNSLDGIVIPTLQIGIIDGTAPHVVSSLNKLIPCNIYYNRRARKSSSTD